MDWFGYCSHRPSVAKGARDGIRRFPARLDARLCRYAMEVNVKDKTWRFSQRAAVTAVSLVLGTAAQAGTIRGNLDPTGTNGIPAYNGFAYIRCSCLRYERRLARYLGRLRDRHGKRHHLPLPWPDGDPPNVPQGTGSDGRYWDTQLWPQPLRTFSAFLSMALATSWDWIQLRHGAVADDSSRGLSFREFSEVRLGLPRRRLGPDRATRFVLRSHGLDWRTGHVPPRPDPAILSEMETARTVPIATASHSQTIPEPGTVSLILGALGGGWLARRRKKKAAA